MEFQILYAINNLHNPILDKIMVAITMLGDIGIFWIILAIVLMCKRKTRKCGILMITSMVVGLIIGNVILKNVIARSRPCWIDQNIPLLIDNLKDYSFPSGHTLISFISATMVFLHNKKWGAVTLIIAALISFSRLYLFVHFPTDVLGGALLGIAIALSVYNIWNKIEEIKEKKNEENVKTLNEIN